MKWIKNISSLVVLGSILELNACTNPPVQELKPTTPIKTAQRAPDNNQPKPSGQLQGNKLCLSLEESIRIALEKNRQVLIAEKGKTKAKGQIKEARSGLYPTLTGKYSYTRLDEVTTFNMGLQEIKIGDEDTYKGEISLQQPLYSGGGIRAGIRSARFGYELSEANFQSVQEAIIFQVTQAYYDILLAEELYEVNKKDLAVAKAHLDDVTKKHKQGVVSDYDLLRAKVRVANSKAGLIQTLNALHLARTSFINILGFSLEKGELEIELTDRLRYKPVGKRELKDLWEIALQYRPALKESSLQIEIQRQNVIQARAEGRPTVSLFGNLGRDKPTTKEWGEYGWESYWNAGVMLSLPLFEGWRIKGKVIQAKTGLKQTELAKQDLEEKIRLEVKQAFLSLQDAEELVESQKENVKQAEEGLRLARIGYQEGVNTQLEVMDAQMALSLARENYAQSLYTHLMAKTAMKKATGRLMRKQ